VGQMLTAGAGIDCGGGGELGVAEGAPRECAAGGQFPYSPCCSGRFSSLLGREEEPPKCACSQQLPSRQEEEVSPPLQHPIFPLAVFSFLLFAQVCPPTGTPAGAGPDWPA
jgi:hypothetical protein